MVHTHTPTPPLPPLCRLFAQAQLQASQQEAAQLSAAILAQRQRHAASLQAMSEQHSAAFAHVQRELAAARAATAEADAGRTRGEAAAKQASAHNDELQEQTEDLARQVGTLEVRISLCYCDTDQDHHR